MFGQDTGIIRELRKKSELSNRRDSGGWARTLEQRAPTLSQALDTPSLKHVIAGNVVTERVT